MFIIIWIIIWSTIFWNFWLEIVLMHCLNYNESELLIFIIQYNMLYVYIVQHVFYYIYYIKESIFNCIYVYVCVCVPR